ncbi:hypothetical protein [Planomonospora algeriensis]
MNDSAQRRPAPQAFSVRWWQDDPEHWQLLQFEAGHDEDGRPVDLWWKDRRHVLHALIRTPDRADAGFARFLLKQETQRHGHSWGFSHTIEIAALLVAEHRRTEDIWLLWEAILRSFDTWCGLPHRLLLSAGAARAVEYVGTCDHPQRDDVLQRLQEILPVTDEEIARLLSERRRYYRGILGELDES